MISHQHIRHDIAQHDQQAINGVAWHALLWLSVANAVGVLLAILLLVPSLNPLLGEWTYGRWMMVHMNLELYGWTSLPLIGFLFRVYKADSAAFGKWCRPLLWVWSAALLAGSLSWLNGHSTGKLFLDWSGFSLTFFVATLLTLWLLLVFAFTGELIGPSANQSLWYRPAKIVGLILLLAVPFIFLRVAIAGSYPAVNPDTGGPTGTSQLESSLAVVFILLALPFGLVSRKLERTRVIAAAWLVLSGELIQWATMAHTNVSHRQSAQFVGLGSMLLWLPLIPAYYASFKWHSSTRRWRIAFQWWWAALVVTGWIFFLPGVLDHFKFTDGLVGHSFVAMAGFTSSLIIFVMVQLLGEDGWIFNRSRAFYLWHGSVIAYIGLMTIAGWREGFDPAFTIVPGTFRNVLYVMRLTTGILMLVASLDWLIDCARLRSRSVSIPVDAVLEEVQ